MDKRAIINSYIGPAGSGKTFKALQDISIYKRQIRLDAQPHGQRDLQAGCKVIREVPELYNYVKENINGGFKVCFHPRDIELKTAFHWVCKIAILAKNTAILADESNRYIDKNLCNAGQCVFFQSRHSQTRLFYTMFNPRYVSPEMRGNTSKVHLFQNQEKNVTDYLKEAGADKDFIDGFTSEKLPPYSYALIETGKKPVMISPRGAKKPSIKPASKSSAAGRRSKK